MIKLRKRDYGITCSYILYIIELLEFFLWIIYLDAAYLKKICYKLLV